MNTRWARVGAIALVAAWAAWLSYATIDRPSVDDVARGFSSLGGGPINGGGGISKVTLSSNAANLASGSGTPSNALLVTACSTGNVTGSGSSGSCFDTTSSPSFSGITALAGFTNSGEIVATGSATPAALSGGTTYDWDWTNSGTASAIYIVNETPSADSTIGGMLAGATGQQIVLKNLSTSKKLTLNNEDSSETTAARRFTLPDSGTLVIRPLGSLIMRYASTSRWIPLTTAVTDAGNGLSRSGSTASVNAGSGLTADSTNLRVNNGNGLNFSSGALQVNAGSGITADSTNTRANLGTGLTFSGGAIVPNLAGGTCSNEQAVTALSSSGTATCGNLSPNVSTGTWFYWSDEWEWRTITTDFVEGMNGSVQGTNTSIMTADVNGAAGRPGIQQMNMGNTTTGRVSWVTSLGAIVFSSGVNYGMRWIGGVELTSSSSDAYSFRVGFWDTLAAVNQTSGCYFLYDERQVAAVPTTGARCAQGTQKLNCVSSSASTRTEYCIDGTTVSDASFTTVNYAVGNVSWPSTNVMNLRVEVTGTGECDFYIGDVKSCVITSHIPTAALGRGFEGLRNTAATANRLFDTDFTAHWYQLSSSR